MIWLAVAIWLAAVGLSVGNVLVGGSSPGVFASLGADPASAMALFAVVGLVSVGYATAGLLILRQRLRHAVGWLLLVAGPLICGVFSAAIAAVLLRERGDPAAGWFALYASYGWVPAVTLAGPALALIFPDGRLPGPRWRLAVGVVAAVLIVALLAVLFAPGALGPEEGAPTNPLGFVRLPEWAVAVLEVSGVFLLLAMLGISVAAVVVRFRRAGPDERRQLKWFVFAVLILAVMLPPSFFIESAELFIVSMAVLVLVPLSVLIAITRYRLYEIDTLINRTLVYVPLVGIVAGLYAASVALFQRLFVQFTGDTSDAAAIISALILASVFTPIRKWIEGVVDRRFKPAAPAGPPSAGLARSMTPATAAASVSGSPAVTSDEAALELIVERVVRRVLADERAPATPGPAPATPGPAPATPGPAPATPGPAPATPAPPGRPPRASSGSTAGRRARVR